MKIAGNVLAVLVALEHLWFFVLESFLFRSAVGLETFHQTQLQADTCAVLAQNQGLYNAFLAAALGWAVVTGNLPMRRFVLGCVVVAGVVGSATVGDKTIVLAQSLPAALALALTLRQELRQPA